MTKPRLVKVGALFYVFQQVTNSDEKRVHQNFDTPSVFLMKGLDYLTVNFRPLTI